MRIEKRWMLSIRQDRVDVASTERTLFRFQEFITSVGRERYQLCASLVHTPQGDTEAKAVKEQLQCDGGTPAVEEQGCAAAFGTLWSGEVPRAEDKGLALHQIPRHILSCDPCQGCGGGKGKMTTCSCKGL